MSKALKYRVTDAKTGELIVDGNSRECADALFITVESFRATSHRHRNPEKYSTVRRRYNVEEVQE